MGSQLVCHPTICLFQASESKREQFRRYLEKSGVLDTLTSGKWRPPPPPFSLVTLTIMHSVKQSFNLFLLISVLPLFLAVLVALYEEPEKPNNALEYPFLIFAALLQPQVVTISFWCGSIFKAKKICHTCMFQIYWVLILEMQVLNYFIYWGEKVIQNYQALCGKSDSP